MAEKKKDRSALLLALALVVLAAAGGGVVYNVRPDLFQAVFAPAATDVDPADDGDDAGEAVAAIKPPEAGQDSADPGPSDAAALPPPTFDVVRVDAGGSALIAGKAPPRFDVAIEIDGAEVTRTASDGTGAFAAVFDVTPRDVAQVVVLVAYGAPGEEVRSNDSVILAPQLQAPGADAPLVGIEAPLPDIAALQPGDPQPQIAGQTAPGATSATPTPPALSGSGGSDPALGPTTTAERPQVLAETGSTSGPGAAPALDVAVGARTPATDLPGPGDPLDPPSSAPDTAETSDTTALEPDVEAPVPVDRPDQAPAVLLAGRDGVRVLQPAGAAEQTLPSVSSVVLDSISYSAGGAVVLTGRGPEDGALDEILRVYLNNRQIIDAEIAEDGSFEIELQDVEIGVYTLRLDRLDAQGRVTSRFETPFQREDPETLARFSQSLEALEGPERLAASVVTVQPGVTLWGIASTRYGDGFSYLKVFEANKDQIRNPDLIYPGQVFDLPD